MLLTRTSGCVRIEAASYALEFRDGEPFARLFGSDGRPWADLALLAEVDTCEGLDETAEIRLGGPEPVPDDGESKAFRTWRAEVEATSSRWARKVVSLSGDEATIRIQVRVEGAGRLTNVRLLGGA